MNEAEAGSHYQRGMDAKAERKFRLAAREFERAIEINDRYAEAYRELGWVTYVLEDGLEVALNHLEYSVQLEPLQSDAHMYLGIVLNRLKRMDDSEAHFRTALGLSDYPAIIHAIFAEEFLWHNSRYGEAEYHFKMALEHCPVLVSVLCDYARMLTCHGRDGEAMRYFNRALEIDPECQVTKRAHEEFLQDLIAEDRDPDDWLRAAIEKDPNYTEGIKCLADRVK